ncbi:MAG: hypothetical protein ACK515_00880 [bacterium]|nr:hypothetical protein [Betaproteobacteria bacterium]
MPIRFRSLLAAVLCLSALLPCAAPHAVAQDTVSDLSAAPDSGTFRFASATPKTLGELMKLPGPDGSTTVLGHLFMPGAGDGRKVPAVVLIRGSGGIYKAMLDF